MSRRPPPPERLVDLVSTIAEAMAADQLRTTLCEAVAEVTGASVALVEVDGTGIQELARSSGSPEWIVPSITDEPASAGASAMSTVFEVPDVAPRTVLIADTFVEGDAERSVRLLLEVAVAAAQRIASDDRVRMSRTRLRTIGAEIKQLEVCDPGGVDNGPDLSAEFAAAAALLTDREREILADVVRGEPNAAIAERHTVSVETVKTHVKHILHKMGAANRAELIARAR